MDPYPTLRELDELISSRSILQHPFYQAWRSGALTSEQLASYAQVYYPHVAAFPGYLEKALENASDPMVRRELERNLAEELAVPKPHNQLWLDFAAGLGLEREEVKSAPAKPAAQATVQVFERLASSSVETALAALYAYESQQPEVAHQKAEGLAQLYGITDPQALAYFEVHAQADIEHRAGERRALERCLSSGADPQAILQAAGAALDAYWGLLDGVCSQTNIPVAA
jgi:pyrroloquinoline-quinone synthase